MNTKTNKPLKWIVALTILMLNAVIVFGRTGTTGNVSQKVAQLQQQNVFKEEYQFFSVAARTTANDLSQSLSKYSLLNTNSRLADVITAKPDYIKMMIPLDNGARMLPVLLYKVDISPNGFTLMTSDGESYGADAQIVNYRGAIEGDINSIAAVTFSPNEIIGLITNDEGNFVLGKLDNNSAHVMYNDKDLVPVLNFNCGSDASLVVPGSKNHSGGGNSTQSVKCVNWYYEIDYDVYVGKQSNIATVNTFISGIFNQVATLYANDGMTITLQTVYVWTTTDPYTGPSTSNYLTQFGTTRTSFAGDLATLIGYAGGGGVAWINGFCNSQTKYKQSYCGISSSFNNVPTYSWTVEVVAHEQGHLFGSRHTHDCVWNGNSTAIDGCGPAAGYTSGSCPAGPVPSSSVGGTIMSYCHLISAGIKFANGFGPQPTTLILNNLNNASCLVACCATPAQPGTISGSTAACQSSNQTYSIAAVSGASGYTWTLPSGSTGTSTTTSITITLGGTSGNISVTANSSCGSSIAKTLAVTISPVPAQPGNISGNISACPASSQTYSVTAVSGATSYTWTLPSGWSGTSSTNSITSTAGSTGGTLSVKANNSCGGSAIRTLAITISSAGPAQPGTITGNTSVCPATSQTYSVATVAGATSYTWTLPSGWSGTSSTNTITTTTAGTAGNISVTANNSCGSSAARTLAITISSAGPAQPGTITGNTSVCPATSQTYSVATVAGATSYTWTLPSGWSGTSSSNTITTTTTGTAGNISVTANNSCGSSAARTLAITISTAGPAQPGTISGNTSVCQSSSQTYSVATVAGATSYTWTLPSGWSGTSTTNSITPNIGSKTGNVIVTANNGCGSSALRSLSVTVIKLPTQPTTIAGDRAGLCNLQAVPFSVTNVAGLTYNWTFNGAGATIATGQGTNAITVNFSGNASGTLTVTPVNVCGSGTSRPATIKSTPATPSTITGAVSVCANQQGVPYSITPLTNVTSYFWVGPAGSHISDGTVTSTGTSLTTTSTSVTVNYGSTAGLVQARGVNSCGNGSYSKLTVSFGCRLAENGVAVLEGLNVFPNPAHDKLNVVVNAGNNSVVTIKLNDMSGRTVISENKAANEGSNTFTLDINHLSKGIYVLEINNAAVVQKTKVVVE